VSWIRSVIGALPIALLALAWAACGGATPKTESAGAEGEPDQDQSAAGSTVDNDLLDPGHEVMEELGIDGELLQAAKQGDLEGVKRLLGNGASLEAKHLHDPWDPSPFKSSYTPLAYAAYGGHVELFEHLLSAGAEQTEWVLIAAVEGDQPQMTERLLELEAFQGTEVLTTAMVRACMSDNLKAVEKLVRLGADVDGTAHGWEVEMSCLTIAIVGQDLGLAKFMVGLGASVDAGDEGGVTPLMYAVDGEDFAFVEYLLAEGAAVNTEDENQGTALQAAANAGNVEAVRMLLERGAEVNASDMLDSTPLHDAAFSGKVELVELLLQAGADVNAVDAYHKTPLDHARRSKHAEIEQLLLSKGARSGEDDD
jgi:ankyrin repeat protein